MIFIYNNTDAKVGMTANVEDARASIGLTITGEAGQETTQVLTTTDNDVMDTLSKWGDLYKEIRRNPFKTNIAVPNEKRTVINAKDEIDVFSLSDKDDENRKLPRVILFVISRKDAEVYTDDRNVYKAMESVDVGEYKVTKLLIKWGRWSSLKIKTFVTIKDGENDKKLQLIGVQLTNKNTEGKDVTYITNSLSISDMTEEEYQILKNGEIPKFGKESLLVIEPKDNDEDKSERRKPNGKERENRKKEYPNKKKAHHGHGKDNGNFNGGRGKSFRGKGQRNTYK